MLGPQGDTEEHHRHRDDDEGEEVDGGVHEHREVTGGDVRHDEERRRGDGGAGHHHDHLEHGATLPPWKSEAGDRHGGDREQRGPHHKECQGEEVELPVVREVGNRCDGPAGDENDEGDGGEGPGCGTIGPVRAHPERGGTADAEGGKRRAEH